MVISSVTGVLLFFEADSGFAKLAHEWLGWVLVLGAIAHAYTNRASLRAHLSGARGRVVVAAFVLTTIAVIVPWSSGGGGRRRGRGANVEGAGEGGGMRSRTSRSIGSRRSRAARSATSSSASRARASRG
jgi:hypothetical protein